MVIFQELKIENDASKLLIAAKVKPEQYYTDVYIDKVIIDTEETYREGGPSSTPVFIKQFEGNQKFISLQVNKHDIVSPLNNHLYFVYIVTKGVPSPDTPCGMDNVNTLGVTLYLGNFYNMFMQHIKEMDNENCVPPQGLIDLLLRFKALNISIDSGHYIQGIKYFNKWFNGKNLPPLTISNCGCHG